MMMMMMMMTTINRKINVHFLQLQLLNATYTQKNVSKFVCVRKMFYRTPKSQKSPYERLSVTLQLTVREALLVTAQPRLGLMAGF
jgi:hypothetical protein